MSSELQFEPSSLSEEIIESETNELSKRRTMTGRHLAEKVFLDGFIPMKTPESQFANLGRMMDSLIIDQSPAIQAITSALDRAGVRLQNDNRPKATFGFLGPTGVGKSETAKILSELLEDGEGKLLRIDCTDFTHGHEVSKLTGAPPGFAGHKQKPILSKANVEGKNTIILFDEIEKAASELHNIVLPIIGDGELSLNNGELVNFRDTIVIFTSNLGASEMNSLMRGRTIGFASPERETNKKIIEKTAINAFEKNFKPEFTNRINQLVVFQHLSETGLRGVLNVKLNVVNDQYEDEYGVRISLSDATVEHIIEIAKKQPELGARPLVRAFEDNILTTFGRYAGAKALRSGTHIRVFHRSELLDYDNKDDLELVFTSARDRSIKKKPGKVLVFPPMIADNKDEPVVKKPMGELC
ncbi:MAG: clpA2 [Candidatus Saccharibacteria bacterium]|nr:clpA2 [Candidatus Saccharibacteria bacterium]